RDANNVCHIAIPCKDIEETKHFYNKLLACKICREYDDRVTIDFFGDQLVCHLDPTKVLTAPEMYPRHFGITFKDRKSFDDVRNMAIQREIAFFKKEFVRFKGAAEEHLTFFLMDPSNNLIEFKYYYDPRFMY
ncbi:hypothetical protein N9Q47_04850, partial [Vicingaceae bacterium]|nr:hypothetical protein [Vicingaceae bacterium]